MKKNWRKRIEEHSSFLIAKVVAVSDDGTITVRQKGRNTTMSLNAFGTRCAVGDNLTLGRYEGDPQKFVVLGYGGYAGSEQTIP